MMEEHAPPVNTKPITASATTIADEKIPFKEQQQPTEERDMNRNSTTTTSTTSSKKDDGANANPLFKLVDAAASILQPENKTPPPQQQEAQEEEQTGEQTEEQTEQEQTQARDMTTNDAKASTFTPSQQVPVHDKTADINNNNIEKSDDTNKPIASASSAPASPNNANVLKGTKEDLLLDPKIKISFAEHLYNVLEDKEHDDVLQWMPDGKSFTVVNHKKFVLQKMPTLFSIRNMSSFVRKLGRWGFSRVFEKETNNSDVFKHPKFMRDDRAGVRKHVKCLGRAANNAKAHQQQQQQNANNNHAMHPHHLPRQPDFVVCQEPGKAPVVLPNTPTAMGGGGRPLHPHAAAMMMNAYHSHPRHHHPHHPTPFGTRTLVGGGGGGASFMAGPAPPPLSPSCLDEVANASAASAEALYLSHQQQQKAKMEQLAAEQQRLEDLEIERLMKRREMRQQQQQQQQRMFMADQHHHHQQQQRLPPSSSSSPRMTAATSTAGSALMMMGNAAAAAASSSPSLDASMRSQQSLPPQQPLHPQQQQQQQEARMTLPPTHNAATTINNAMDLRRVSMQHGSASLDGSLGRSTSSRYSMHSATAAAVAADQQQPPPPPHVTPTYDSRKVLSAAYETLQRDEMRSRERQAAIRALLAEEQEFEARRRRVTYSGSSAM